MICDVIYVTPMNEIILPNLNFCFFLTVHIAVAIPINFDHE